MVVRLDKSGDPGKGPDALDSTQLKEYAPGCEINMKPMEKRQLRD